MNGSLKRGIGLLVLLVMVTVSFTTVFAQENVTCDTSQNFTQKEDIHIETDDVTAYYKENADFKVCLKDSDDGPVENRSLSISLNDNVYNKTTGCDGKVSLNLNLKPGTYNVSVKFDGSDAFNSTQASGLIKIKKAPLAVSAKDYTTYVDSDLFFKAKVFNEVTRNPVDGIKVKFNVYSLKTKKYSYFYAVTDKNGVAVLNKNLRVGTYHVTTKISDSGNKKCISYNSSGKKVTVKIKPTAEWGCCSFYLQVSGTESVAGFRRDATNAVDIYIKTVKWHKRTAIKQYKLGYSYFFHSITTSDGWMMGTGGIDNPGINRAIENIAGKMVESNKISTSYLKKIQNYERRLGLGHFSIKAPDGRYAVVWLNGYWTGKLKAGEYISVPNMMSCYRHSTYSKFATDPVKAAIKVGATDTFGVNRRDITVFHWKSSTDKNFKTTSLVKTYASNDNGKLLGRSTGYLKDNIHYKNKYISKYKLPSTPKSKFLGTHKFGNIDGLIKTPTVVKAPKVSNKFNQTKYFKITVKNKKTNKLIKGIKVRIKVSNSTWTKVYILKTDKSGLIKVDTKYLGVGSYDVSVSPANNRYLISAKSKIQIVG